jgi:hypothetical protein
MLRHALAFPATTAWPSQLCCLKTASPGPLLRHLGLCLHAAAVFRRLRLRWGKSTPGPPQCAEWAQIKAATNCTLMQAPTRCSQQERCARLRQGLYWDQQCMGLQEEHSESWGN